MPVEDLALAAFPLFQGLNPEVVKESILVGERRHFPVGEALVFPEDGGQTFFIILNGTVKVSLHRPDAEQISIIVLKDGDFFGELALLENAPLRTATVVALTDVEVMIINKKDFNALMLKYVPLALNLARVLGQRIRLMNERMIALTLPLTQKIARTLMYIAKKPPLEQIEPVTLPPLSLQEWALFSFCSPAEFEQAMAQLQAAGVLAWDNPRISLKNIAALKEFAA